MLQVIKKFVVVGSVFSLSACASLFSAYDSDFSCKNSDHGGCEHPLKAYENARAAEVVDHSKNSDVPETTTHEEGIHTPHVSNYESYQDAVYGELQGLVSEPDTPIIAPAKIVRTLILPYTDPKQSSRLYMPRYVYSVLESSKFVLGDYLIRSNGGLSLQSLFSKPAAQTLEEKE